MHFAVNHGLLVLISVWTQSFKQSQGFWPLFSFSQCLWGSLYKLLSEAGCTDSREGCLDHPEGGLSAVGCTNLGSSHTLWWEENFGLLLIGESWLCFVSFTACLVPSPSLLIVWKDVRAGRPRGRARLRAVSLEEDALILFPSLKCRTSNNN